MIFYVFLAQCEFHFYKDSVGVRQLGQKWEFWAFSAALLKAVKTTTKAAEWKVPRGSKGYNLAAPVSPRSWRHDNTRHAKGTLMISDEHNNSIDQVINKVSNKVSN